jgi:hypothetical protein
MPDRRPHLLPPNPDVPEDLRDQVRRDHDLFARTGLPADLDRHLIATYGLDMTASYAGSRIRNPWGKASGQLSLNSLQVAESAQGGLGFVVRKTVIAQDAQGHQSMSAWAIKESRMDVEPIMSRSSRAMGWTVTWKGRGWWRPFSEYLTFFGEAIAIGAKHDLLIVPSVKYHLPAPGEAHWREEEYIETTRSLLHVHEAAQGSSPMPLEKDFSPTLAGSDLATQRIRVLEWIRHVPELIRKAVPKAEQIKVGLKLFNSLDDDRFQLDMLAEAHQIAM